MSCSSRMINRYNKAEAQQLINELGAGRHPFLFIIDFEHKKIIVEGLDALPPGVLYNFNGVGNDQQGTLSSGPPPRLKGYSPISYEEYLHGYKIVHQGLMRGDSFLTNLTYGQPD